ncbi:MAG: hypothetical protein FWH08_01690 [Oscillospiraceae bacterium]|nr:hypothetical protein [Oscillospiraceae bacterium]
MISRITKINSSFLKYAAYRMYTMRARITIMGFCGLLSFPLIILATALQENYYRSGQHGNAEGVEIFFTISICLTMLSVTVFALLTYSNGVNCYDYYNRREKVDMIWCLPLKNKQKFWGDFISGLLPIVIIYTLSALLGLIVFRIFMPDLEYYSFYSALVMSLMVIGLVTAVSVYILSVFCACLCGKPSSSVIYPAIICIIIPAIITLISLLLFGRAWQMEVYEPLKVLLAATSPGGFAVCSINDLTASIPNDNLGMYMLFLRPEVLIPFVLINAGFLTGAYYLSKKRNAESTGKPFAVKHAALILISLVMFCITASFVYTMDNASPGSAGGLFFGLFVSTLIVFLVLDAMAHTGKFNPKKLANLALRYVAMVGGSFLISSLLLTANGFGAAEYIPPADKIQSVSINLYRFDDDYVYVLTEFRARGASTGSYRKWGDNSANETTFTDSENIGVLRGIHYRSNAVGDFVNPPWDRSTITYTLNSGRKITRYINLFEDDYEIHKLTESEEYKRGVIEKMEIMFENGNVPLVSFINFENDIVISDSLASNREIQDEEVRRLFEAFKLDYLSNSDEHSWIGSYGVILFRQNDNEPFYIVAQMNVRPHYTNLLAEIERMELESYTEPTLVVMY